MGIASRRKAEEIIREGRVTVNGQLADLGMKADPESDHIKLDGKLLINREPKVYYMFHKPAGVITTLGDPEGRASVADFLSKIRYRVFPVGRLDYDSEGLLLITNDGEFAHAIMHPTKKIAKTYVVKVKGVIEEEKLEKLRAGMFLKDGPTAPAKVKKVRKLKENSVIEITITEGRKRQVRRMMDHLGHSVVGSRALGSQGSNSVTLRQARFAR